MTDVFDRGQKREQELRDDALAEHRRRTQDHEPRPSATHCTACGDPIPKKRQLAEVGVQTCVECQKDIERQAALRRRMGK